MTWFRCGGSGIPAALKNRMNAVLNKKFGTAVDYPAEGWPDDVNLMGPLPEKTIVSSPIADFSDGADDVPTKSLVVTIPPTLSGVLEVTETQTGRNLFDISTATNGQINGTNGAYYANANWQASDFFQVHGSNLTLSWDTDSSNYYQVNLAFYDSEKHYVDGSNNTFANIYSKTFTIHSGAVYCRASWSISVGGSPAPRNNIRINLGSTDGGYTPYTTPTQYTASLGRTIYGGKPDIVNGTGKETHKGYTLDNLTWSGGIIDGKDWCWYVDLSADNLKLPANSAIFSGICDNYTPIRFNGVSSTSDTIALRDNGRLYVNNGSDTTQPTGKVTIELATPIDFTFTGQEINTRLGYNAFWSDEGDTEVTYRRDIDLALQALSGSRGLMMASRPAIEPSNGDQGSEESTENNIETEGEEDAR